MLFLSYHFLIMSTEMIAMVCVVNFLAQNFWSNISLNNNIPLGIFSPTVCKFISERNYENEGSNLQAWIMSLTEETPLGIVELNEFVFGANPRYKISNVLVWLMSGAWYAHFQWQGGENRVSTHLRQVILSVGQVGVLVYSSTGQESRHLART